MSCPRCKVDLVSRNYENVSVDSCGQCGGIWLQAENLPPILSAHDVTFPPSLIEKTLKEAHAGIPKAEPKTAGEALLSCPRCAHSMNAMNYDYSSGVIIHVCPGGHGLWFDKDQLAQIQIFMEHWDEEERKNKQKWAGMAKQAQQDEYAKLDQQDAAMRSHLSPIERTLDAVLYQFEKLGRGRDE